jgi:hypothetical protein
LAAIAIRFDKIPEGMLFFLDSYATCCSSIELREMEKLLMKRMVSANETKEDDVLL